jgi:hypothetical protein
MIATDDLIGKAHQRGGRGPDAFDCWGVVLVLAERSGIVVPPDWASRDMTRSEQRALMAGEAMRRTDRLPGPVDRAIAYSESAAHVGFVLGRRIIHSVRGAGVVSWPFGLWTSAFPDGTFHSWRK